MHLPTFKWKNHREIEFSLHAAAIRKESPKMLLVYYILYDKSSSTRFHRFLSNNL